MTFGNATFVDACIDEILSEGPVDVLGGFLTSALLDLRRAMVQASSLVRDRAITDHPAPPRRLRTDVRVPPWEAELLSAMFSRHPIVVFQGGSGCGKSSAAMYAEEYCAHWCRYMHEVILPLGRLMLRVDLQDEGQDVRDDTDDEARRAAQRDRFLGAVCARVDTAIKLHVPPGMVSVAMRDAFIKVRAVPYVNDTETVRFMVREHYNRVYPEMECTGAVVNALLDTPGQVHQRLVTRYLLLQALGETQVAVSDLPFVLIIDNIDPFPEYLQAALIQSFKAIVHGARAPGHHHTAFKLVVFSRLSTATRHSGALDGVQAHLVDFKGPDPADLVFFRLTAFLLNPAATESWSQLSDEDQREVLGRCSVLWEKLSNPIGQVTRVLSGLAGTNGRTGCKLAAWWLASDRLPALANAAEHIDGSGGGLAAAALAVLLRVANAVARLVREGVDGEVAPQSGEDAVKQIVERFYKRLIGILVGNHVVRLAAKGGQLADGGVRWQLAATTRAEIHRLMDGSADELALLAGTPMALAAYDVSRRAGVGLSEAVELASRLDEALLEGERERNGVLAYLVEDDQVLAARVCAWLREAAVRGVRGELVETNTGEAIRRCFPRAPGQPLRPVVGHWQAVSTLISPDSAHSSSDRSALNVFSVTGRTLCPVPLHVLCILEEAGERRTGGGMWGPVLKQRLEEWNFSEAEIIAAWNSMVPIDRRLIYSGVMDQDTGVNAWLDWHHEVHIASAGSGYLRWVVATPAYLQWALFQLTGGREATDGGARRFEGGLERLRFVADGLDMVLNDERARAQKMADAAVLAQLKSASPLGWVLFPSLRRFMWDLSGLKKVSEAKARVLGERFIDLGHSVRASYIELFGSTPIEWDNELGAAVAEYRERFEGVARRAMKPGAH